MNQKQTKTIVIDQVEFVKSGSTGNRSWSMYRVTTMDGEEYTTFDAKYVNMVGHEITIDYEERQGAQKKDGSYFVNRTIIEKPASKEMVQSLREKAGMEPQIQHHQAFPPTLPANEARIIETLQRIEKKVDSVLDQMNPLL